MVTLVDLERKANYIISFKQELIKVIETRGYDLSLYPLKRWPPIIKKLLNKPIGSEYQPTIFESVSNIKFMAFDPMHYLGIIGYDYENPTIINYYTQTEVNTNIEDETEEDEE